MKKIIKLFKKLVNWIKFKFFPDSLTKKEVKKIKKERKISMMYSNWGNFLRFITGCDELKLSAYA